MIEEEIMIVQTTLPNWLQNKYSVLYNEFEDKKFSREDAVKILGQDKKTVSVILSDLKKSGFLKIETDPNDARKSLYRLKPREEVIRETLSVENGLTRDKIDSILKKAADLIRTRVDYTFILILLFYKRISDKWEVEFKKAYKEAIEDGLSEEEAKKEAKSVVYHDFDLPEEYLWENIRKDPAKLPENFSKAMKTIAERNPDLKDIFTTADFVQFTTSRENAEILRQLVEVFSEETLHHVSPDILGDAYEWILRYFAPQKAKEGEVYTPREVIRLLIEMLDPKPEESVYDPACGSGGMLIISYDHVKEEYGPKKAERLFLYGQEANHKTLALSKMNLYIHNIKNAQLSYGDTLLSPKFKEGEKPRQFNIVIANPPWNQDGYNESTLKKGEFWNSRFKFGFPPNQSADWAWIQHMIASAKDGAGKVGIVIDNGCLFRGGKEKSIRARILEEDLIESVILLPEKLFYNTGAPGAIIIFNKNKSEERKNKVLFINASQEYEQHPEVRKLNRLGDEHIEKIAEAYQEFREIEGFSRIVSPDEIKENDFNLNVTLYVFPIEEIEEIDVDKEWEELKEIEKNIKKVEEKIEEFLKLIR